MASKKEESKKPYRLPSVGKPKEKPAKSSVKELGVKANEEYKKGLKNSVKALFGPKKGQVMSEEDFVKYRYNFQKAQGRLNDPAKSDPTYAGYTGTDKKLKKGSPSYYKTRAILARQTGMAKGGLTVKGSIKKK